MHNLSALPKVCVSLAQLCHFINNIRLLGVTVDNHLSFDQHVSDVVRSFNYHIRSLRHIRPLIDCETAVNLVMFYCRQ